MENSKELSKEPKPRYEGTELHEMFNQGDQFQVRIGVAGDELLERQAETTVQKRGNK